MNGKFLILCYVCLQVALVLGQETRSPYAGEQNRAVKSLSEDEIQGYLSGQGMGLAKAAELNRHPGPKHVLELAEQLSLTDEQRRRTEQVYQEMHEEAVRLGEQIVSAETDLNKSFAEGSLDASSLKERLLRISEWQGKLRFVHLNAHLQMIEILTPGQIEKYVALRGYKQDHSMKHHLH